MIQLQFLNYLITSGDGSLLTSNNLNKDFFSDYVEEYKYIVEHIDQYGNVPDMITFLSKFPNFDVIEVNESADYLLDKLYKDKNTRTLASIFNDVKNSLIADDIDKAVEIYMNSVETMTQSKHIDCVDILKDRSRYEAYLERCDNFDKYYVKTGFPELDEIIGGWDREEELVTIAARSNAGKCLEKGTEVLMADGTLKKVEDVRVGDKVQSINNKTNTVLALHNGKSNGYRIIPNSGSGRPFTVSSDHILTLWKRTQFWDAERRTNTTDGTGTLVDIKIEDYLKLSPNQQANLLLYRAPVDYPEKELEIPPYILGLWLGDGTNCRPELTTVDEPIKEAWEDYARSYGYIARKNTSGISYEITKGKKGPHPNILTEKFDNYNLLKNKHIPHDYLTSSKEQRLELLAGLVDTDGWLNKRGFAIQIIQKSEVLTNDICRLLSGLGFKYKKYVTHNKKYDKDYYAINIYGELETIPCRLERKQFKHTYDPAHPRRNPLLANFKIEPVDEIEYYGFMCDGDERYLLADNTVTHNTWVLLKCAVAAVEQGLNVGLYSGEMSERKVGYRIDTLISNISNAAITKGDRSVQNIYKKYIDELDTRFTGSLKVLTPNHIGGPAGVGALRAFIERENLDILFIDQHSLLEDDRRARVPHEKAANISKDLKNLQTLKKIPIIAVSQQNRNSTENGVGLEHIAQSDRIAQDSTIVLFFEQKDGVMTMHLVKSRDSVNMKDLQYDINLNNGTFIYRPETETDDTNLDLEDNFRIEDEIEEEDVF